MILTMWKMSVCDFIVSPSSLDVDVCSAFIDQVGFKLKGTFHNDPSTRRLTAFLFAPPLPIEYINNMPCIEYPLPESLYWSLDQEGKTRIPESDWEKYNIPKLELQTWIGSYWDSNIYDSVRDVLSAGKYNLDGRQYAKDHGHSELIRGEQHLHFMKLTTLTLFDRRSPRTQQV